MKKHEEGSCSESEKMTDNSAKKTKFNNTNPMI